MAAVDARTPSRFTPPVFDASMTRTPTMPSAAPALGSTRGRSPSSGQARSMRAIGEVAMTIEATLVGSSCAVT